MTKIQDYTGNYLKQSLEELLDEVTVSITSQNPQAQVILFGSYARGDYTQNSDMDICVLVPKLTSRREEMAVDAMCAIPDNFPLPYDLVLYTFDEFEEDKQNKNLLGYKIYKDGVMLNDKKGTGRIDFANSHK